MNDTSAPSPLLGLRTVIYPAPDLPSAKPGMTRLLGVEPYFDTDFTIGYTVAGYELALDPHADPAVGAITYWGVADIDTAAEQLLASGGVLTTPIEEVGDGIRTATIRIPGIPAPFGLIENPHFTAAHVDGSGPGR